MTIHTYRRRVFGRLRINSGGKRYHVELTREGVRIRPFFGRRWHTIAFSSVIGAMGEMVLGEVEVQ